MLRTQKEPAADERYISSDPREAGLPNIIEPNWLSGYIAGNGKLMIIISKNENNFSGFEISTVLNISQRGRESIELIKKIQLYFNCGTIYKTDKETRIVIKKFSDIFNIILPYFDKFPLNNYKQIQFREWSRVVNMLKYNKYLTNEQFEIIKNIRNKM